MNIFQSNSAQFRHGNVLDNGATTPSKCTDVSVLRGEAGIVQTAAESASFTFITKPQVTDLSALLAAAKQQQPHHTSAQSASTAVVREGTTNTSPKRSAFPSTPYYGLLSNCEVHVDVALIENGEEGMVMVNTEEASAPAYNPPSTMRRLRQMEDFLNSCAERHGAVYYLGTLASPYEPAASAASSSASPASLSSLTYITYVEAMQDAFRQMTQLRTACSTAVTAAPTQHCFYMRILSHPLWKDLGLLLCVEQSRLLLCLLSSSRVTQKRLTALCAEVNVELEWLSGAALVVEPTSLTGAEVNPVWVLWDAVVHLPLLMSSLSSSSANGTATGEGTAVEGNEATGFSSPLSSSSAGISAGVRGALEVLRRSSEPIRGCQVALVSSLPFRNARRCSPVGRFVEEALLYSPGAPPIRTAAATNTTGDASSSCSFCVNDSKASDTRCPVARRYVWRVLPSYAWMLPHFLTQLTKCLVETCKLHTFTLRCGGTSIGNSSSLMGAPVDGFLEDQPKRINAGTAGVRLVHGDAPSFVQLRRGPSTVSWTAFSRLSSGAAWVDAETREGLAFHDLMGHTDEADGAGEEEGGEGADEMELEFELNTVQYVRCVSPSSPDEASSSAAAAAPARKRPRDAVESEETKQYLLREVMSNNVKPAAWGPSFTFGVSVKRLIVVDDDGE